MTRSKIYVCSNNETLADGVVENRVSYGEEIGVAVSEVVHDLLDAGYDADKASIFADWHGGKFYRAGGKIGDSVYGYRNGNVATLETNPSPELIAAVDKASDLLSDKIEAIGKLEDAAS